MWKCPTCRTNLEAVISVLQFIYDNIMYAELNTKSDYCQCCGYDGEIKIVEDDGKLVWECPKCGNRDQNKLNVARRTCGLSALSSGIRAGRGRSRTAFYTCDLLQTHRASDDGRESIFPIFAIELPTIKYYDIANGPGVRTECLCFHFARHHCPGCFNEVAWDFGYGKALRQAIRNEVFASCQPAYITGLKPSGRRAHGAGKPAELLPSSGISKPSTRTRPFGATPATWGAAHRQGPLSRGAKSPTSCWPCWTSS